MKIEKNNIYCGDAADLLESMDPEGVDLTVTSPPYDGLRKYNGYVFDFERIARGLFRATKPGGVLVWVVSDETRDGSESGTSFRQALYFKEIGFNLFDTMIYKVDGTGAKGSRLSYWQGFELMLVLSKGRPKTINLIKDKKNRKAGAAYGTGGEKMKKLGSRERVGNRGDLIIQRFGIRDNVWEYHAGQNGDDPGDHPAPFPEDLARDHIISWSKPGDLVLDPMSGSGTTPKMAKALSRDWIGFDVSEEYCQMARARVEASSLPLLDMLAREARLREDPPVIKLPGME